MFFLIEYSNGGLKTTFQPGVQCQLELDLGKAGRLRLLGDPVMEIPSPRLLNERGELYVAALYTKVRGHYYWFLEKEDEIRCGSSFGSIFPLYYQEEGGRIRVCSSSFFLAKEGEAGQANRRYLLERQLFNYPFFDATPWSGIRLLPAHGVIRIARGKMSLEKPFAIEAYFGEGRQSSAESLHTLCEKFESECRLFMPEKRFAISFTGGFDGRTLLAGARKAGRTDFLTYSFGMSGEPDVTFPRAQAAKLGIPYLPIYLDEDYVERHAFDSALAFMELTDYNGNLGRPHYHYAAKILSEKVDYILTGNFGSELFRAMHQPGEMMTEALIRIFSSPDGSWKNYLLEKAGPDFRPEAEALIADLEAYLAAGAALTPNQRFYRFVIEEIFRKYFGPELVMQRHFLRNRTPYLSLPFFRALNNTIWSGVHADLFEKQKRKRMKGQVFYAAFLRYADRRLYQLPTNKGYSPADVLENWRLPLLAARVVKKKLFERELADSNSVGAYFSRYKGDLALRFQIENKDADIGQYAVLAAWNASLRSAKIINTQSTPNEIRF